MILRDLVGVLFPEVKMVIKSFDNEEVLYEGDIKSIKSKIDNFAYKVASVTIIDSKLVIEIHTN